ncbi:unnamed protein product [Orchesella dallaii]|uniref:Uncharacterized protein n=1 Tax=Orchesella dallaii TaxID=48710 RepID=A0ABP1S0N4_9HEXA
MQSRIAIKSLQFLVRINSFIVWVPFRYHLIANRYKFTIVERKIKRLNIELCITTWKNTRATHDPDPPSTSFFNTKSLRLEENPPQHLEVTMILVEVQQQLNRKVHYVVGLKNERRKKTRNEKLVMVDEIIMI